MPDVKISELAAASSLGDLDVVPVSQGSATRKATVSQLAQAMTTSNRWTSVSGSVFTATPASTSRIAMSDTTAMKKLIPVRWVQNSVTFYGVIANVSEDSYIDVSGPPINTGINISSLQYSTPEVLGVVDIFLPGNFAVSAITNAIISLTRSSFVWNFPTAYLAYVFATTRVAGGSARITPTKNGTSMLTSNSGSGMTVGADTNRVASAFATINPAIYQVVPGNLIEIAVSNPSPTPSDLTVTLMFVIE